MDCRSLNLHGLPTLAKSDTYSLTEVYMNHNNIKWLDQKILASWDLLEYINLSDNPLDCTELVKVDKKVNVVSECPSTTDGE